MRTILLTIILVSLAHTAFSQRASEGSNPRGAFLRSLAVPGWGHHYVDSQSWTRGQVHLGAELALLLSYFGLNVHSNNLRQNWQAYAVKEAGVDVEGRARSFQLAVGSFNSLADYNDYQTRARNWDRLIDETPENSWQWQGDRERQNYNSIRSRFETIDQQLPALLGLMVVNRLISGISAYNRARNRNVADTQSYSSVYLTPAYARQGVAAHLRIAF